jgi:hypothetical protein
MKKLTQIQRTQMFVPAIFFLLLLVSLFVDPLDTLISGYIAILTSPSILLTDYIVVGGLGATLFNVATTTLLNLILLHRLKIKMTGPVFAALFTIAGFGFFGKNLYNALPIYFGVYLYSLATKTEFRNHILVLLFSSGISPIVSFLMFGIGIPPIINVVVAISVGIIIGFVLPAFNSHALRFHQGYNLYNTGFSMGVISMMATAIIQTFTPMPPLPSAVNNDYHVVLLLATVGLSVFFLVCSYLYDPLSYKQYGVIIKKSGRLVTDFVRDAGIETTLLNVGLMGLLTVVLILVSPIQINGPVMGAILTIMGFGAFGKHPKNSIPVVLGAVLAIVLIPSIEWTMGPILAVLFVTGLAPLAGRFGFIPGIIAGFLHLLITSRALSFQGGFDLYNNGFAAGFVAAVLSPLFHTFREAKEGDPA